jgi:hypothetical protein
MSKRDFSASTCSVRSLLSSCLFFHYLSPRRYNSPGPFHFTFFNVFKRACYFGIHSISFLTP